MVLLLSSLFGKYIVNDNYERALVLEVTGTENQQKEAFNLYLKSAEEGYAKGQFTIGVYYREGKEAGIEQDYVEAVKWYKLSARQGYAPAQHNLGFRYLNGQGIKKNYIATYYWWSKAAKQGYVQVQNSLSKFCENESWACNDKIQYNDKD